MEEASSFPKGIRSFLHFRAEMGASWMKTASYRPQISVNRLFSSSVGP
jgi:hypothetical protein